VSSIVGLLIVFGCVIGGYLMAGGPLAILVQPNEIVVIVGAAIGALVVCSPGRILGRVGRAFKHGFTPHPPSNQDYLELLKLLYELFQLMRRHGMLALESHVNEPQNSEIFKRYPSVIHRAEAKAFLFDGLRQMVDGCPVDELALLFDADLETFHDEEHQPISLIKGTSDALPGLGIVAAVLGIIVTMSHLGGPPEEIGHHVAAALVGTFLGILLCYGVLSPLATSLEMQGAAMTRYLRCIKDGLLAAARGLNPALAIEFARRAIFADERPTSEVLQKELAALKGS
jgi:chemotaxis protein MotA